MGRTEREPGPDGGKSAGKSATDPAESNPHPEAGASASDRPAVESQGERARGTTPGGSGLAALLIQNRTKTGRQTILGQAPGPAQVQTEGGEGAIPQRSRPSTGSFDLLDITAVGGAPPSESQPGSSPAGGAAAPLEAAGGSPRVSHPTPGGGLPGLLARTQLGMGDEVRAALEAARKTSSLNSLITLQPLRPTAVEVSGGGSDGGQTTALGASLGDALHGPRTEVGASVLAATEQAVPKVAPEQESAAVTAAVTQSAGLSPTAPAEPSGGVVASSGPVFALASGPVSGTSGPAFDLGSGPIPGAPASATQAAASARSTHPTPATGRLAALLAESRKRTGRYETLDKVQEKSEAPVSSGVVPPSDASGVPGAVPPTSSVPAAFVPVAPEASGNTTEAKPSADVSTVRVPGAELAQKKGPGFAATLLGLPGPEQQSIQAALASIRQRVTGGAPPASGPDQRRDAGAPDAAARQNTPLPVEGDATERSLLTSGDARAAAASWGRNSDERKRVTDVVDVVRPAGPSRAKVVLVVGAGLMGIAAIIVAGAARKASKNRAATAAAAVRAHVPAAPVEEQKTPEKTAAPSTSAGEEPGPGAVAEKDSEEGVRGREEEAPAAVAEAEAALKVPAAALGREGKTGARVVAPRKDGTRAEQPAVAAAVHPDVVGRESGAGSLAGNGDADDKRKAARSDSRRSETRHAEVRGETRSKETKVRRRTNDSRAGRGESPTAASFEQQPDAPRVRPAALRPDNDPDAVMPLSTR